MKVLLKEGAAEPTPATILVPTSRGEITLETLIGERMATTEKGVIAEFDEGPIIDAVNAAAVDREDRAGKDLAGHLRHLNKGLSDYEVGSKIGIQETSEGVRFDDSEAQRVNRAEGLSRGDQIAIGPSIRPKAYMNARGKVVSVGGGKVEIDLDPGDRDRIERERGKPIAERLPIPVSCVEKVG